MTIDEAITPGPTGVTNEQMRPALKKWIAERNVEALTLIHDTYRQQFEHTMRYVSVKERAYLVAQFGEPIVDPEKMALTNRLKPGRVGVTNKHVAAALEQAVVDRDSKLILLIRKHFPDRFEGAMGNVKSSTRQVITLGLENTQRAEAELGKPLV